MARAEQASGNRLTFTGHSQPDCVSLLYGFLNAECCLAAQSSFLRRKFRAIVLAEDLEPDENWSIRVEREVANSIASLWRCGTVAVIAGLP